MAPNSNRSMASLMGAVVTRHERSRNDNLSFPLAPTLVAALAAGCAGPGPTRAPPPDAPEVSAACLLHPKAQALPVPDGPRDFFAAHEAFQWGTKHADESRPQAALEAFTRALAADPGFGLAHLGKAEAHLLTDNDTAAIRAHLATALVLLPDNPRAHLAYAGASAEAGAAEAAETHWGCALELKPGLSEAHAARARFRLNAGRAAEAEVDARAALAPDPTAYRLQLLLAEALEAQDRPRPAAEAVEAAAVTVSRSAALFRRAARLYAKAGAEADAARMTARADTLDPPAPARDLRPLKKRKRRRRRKTRRR